MSLGKNSLGESKLGLSYYPAELLSKIKFNNLYKKKFNSYTCLKKIIKNLELYL